MSDRSPVLLHYLVLVGLTTAIAGLWKASELFKHACNNYPCNTPITVSREKRAEARTDANSGIWIKYTTLGHKRQE